MEQSMQLDQETLISVLQNRIAQAAIREAQMESAIQYLLSDNRQMAARIEVLENPPVEVTDQDV